MSKEKSKIKKEEKHKTKKGEKFKIKKEEKHSVKKENELEIKKDDGANDSNVNKFDLLVKRNKDSRKPWYYGLEGNWWWGMTEGDARKGIESEQISKDNQKMAIASVVQNKEEKVEAKIDIKEEKVEAKIDIKEEKVEAKIDIKEDKPETRQED